MNHAHYFTDHRSPES